MGSFNTTCFATNQTIGPYDRCRVVPVLQQSTYRPISLSHRDETLELYGIASSTCYADGFWRPLAGFITAKYDDYGRVELLLDELSRARLLTFFGEVLRLCPIVAQGENEYHDLPFDFAAFLAKEAPQIQRLLNPQATFPQGVFAEDDSLDEEIIACWNYVWEVAQEHRLFMRDHSQRMRPLQFAILHEKAYEALFERRASGVNWDNESMAPAPFLQRKITAIRKEVDEYINSKTDKDLAYMRGFFFTDRLREAIDHLTNGDRYYDPVENAIIQELADEFMEGKLAEDQFIEQMIPIVKDRYVHGGLNELNLRFSPMVYSGQDYQNEIGEAYAKLVAAVSKQVTRGRKEECYGEYLPYTIVVAQVADLDPLRKATREADGDIDDVEVIGPSPAEADLQDGLLVRFSCPLKLDDLKDVISELEDNNLRVETLKSETAAS